MRLLKTLAVAVLVLGLAACQSLGGPKQTGGTIIGAGLGALAGSQIGSGSGQLAAVAIGTLLGAFIGSEVGASLDRADQLYAEQTAVSALDSSPANTTSTWQNPDSGNSGTFTPYSAYSGNEGATCREFEQTINVDGESQKAAGTACQQPDGNWKIIKSGTAG